MSALRPSGSTRRWRRIRRLVLERDGYRCKVPGDDGRPCDAYASHVDHVVRRRDGGTDAPANLRAACQPCNLKREQRQQPVDARPSRTPGWVW